jgi:predicted metalloendopeptidase
VRTRFEERTQCVDDQYAQYEALPGVKLNGKLTLGENIADAGGVKLAFHAYRALRESPAEVYVADGFTEDQQFFISMAQVWCFKYREEFARLRAKTDPHAQPNWRVIGALRNTPEFADAFQCADGSSMRPAASCSVW